MIINRLFALMAAKGQAENRRVTLSEISQATGINTSTLSRMSHQALQECKFKDLDKLCIYFQCAIGELLEHVPAEAAPQDQQNPIERPQRQ